MRVDTEQKNILENFVIAAINTDRELIFENNVFSDLPNEKFQIHFADEFLRTATQQEILKEAEAALSSGKDRESFEILDTDSKKWFCCKAFLLRENGKVTSSIVSYFDVTKRKEREDCVKDSEKLLKYAQHIAHVGTWEWNITKDKMIWSEEVYKIYGREKTFNVTFQSHFESLHEDDRERVLEEIKQAINKKVQFHLDKRIVRPDGTIRYLHTYGQPAFDKKNEICAIIGVCQDITEYKTAEISLEQTLSLLRATIESTADGILVVDDEGKIITFNQKFIDIWKIPKHVLDLRSDAGALEFVMSQLKNPSQFMSKVQELYSDPSAESFDTLEFIDERVIERYSKAQIIKNKPAGRVWSFRDVTARVHAEREATAASIAKTQFLANISHEIRTPLTAILGFSDLLADASMNSAERLDLVARVQIQGSNLLRIVDDILDLSKIEFGNFHIKESTLAVVDLVRELKQIFIFKLKEKQTQLIFSTVGSVPCEITTDAIRLKQILMNLIGNAIKFTASGTVEVKLKFLPATEKRQSQLAFLICDTGIGMDMTQAQKLFEPFVQIDSSLTRKFSGTGLGLALSKDLAQALGGTVNLIESTPGSGSKFEAVVNTGDVSKVLFISNLNVKYEEEFNDQTEMYERLDGLKVLLVEDSVDNQFIITQYLKKAGAELVDCALNGKDGVAKARAGNYDIVFMDLQMPLMNGYEATHELRAGGFTKPIIALTAHAMSEEIKRCMEAGCNYHLGKPIDRNKIISTAYHYSHLEKN